MRSGRLASGIAPDLCLEQPLEGVVRQLVLDVEVGVDAHEVVEVSERRLQPHEVREEVVHVQVIDRPALEVSTGR